VQAGLLNNLRTPTSIDSGRTNEPLAGSFQWIPSFQRVLFWMVILFAVILAVETTLRIPFPWDMYFWAESPFMTNMLKLHNHLPIFTDPADGNSFVYSPGLEYLTFAVLKPLGLELDVRYCRLVSTLLGLMAAGFGAMAVSRFARSAFTAAKSKLFFVATWSVIWLVLSKNFMADITHPDNLHAFHATLVFWLTLTALETRRLGLAALTVMVAGLGVFAKQTNALALLGPLLAFAIRNPWGWRQWLLLLPLGGLILGISVYLLWLPHYARFFTFDLPAHQGFWPTKLYAMITDFLTMDRALLAFLAFIAVLSLWHLRGQARPYLVCWCSVGLFSVLPATLAYLKSMGIWNNLIIFQVWFVMLVWPFFGILLEWLAVARPTESDGHFAGWDIRVIPGAIAVLAVGFLVLLFPMKLPPRYGYYAYGRAIESAVRADLQAGRKVLVSHGTEFLIRSGDTTVPRDRANSILEMNWGEVGNFSAMRERIKGRYYDRIYLIMGDWYGPQLLDSIGRNYVVDRIVPAPAYTARHIYGYSEMMEDCRILSPRTN
jgi:hypothetical protein